VAEHDATLLGTVCRVVPMAAQGAAAAEIVTD
jgi:hypothetical protein